MKKRRTQRRTLGRDKDDNLQEVSTHMGFLHGPHRWEATLSQLSHPCFSIVMKHQSRYEEKYAYRFPFATVPVATVSVDHVTNQGKARTDSNVSNVWNCDLRNTSINNRLVRRVDPADQCISLQFETNFRLNCKAKNKG